MAAAGTDVVVDILFLQRRRPGQEPSGLLWDSVAEVVPAEDGEDALCINRYFAKHPEMVLGEHARTSSAFGPVYTCRARSNVAIEPALEQALDIVSAAARIPVSASVAAGRPKAARIVVGTAAEGATVKEGSYVLLGLDLMQIIDGQPVPVAVRSATCKEGVFAKHARVIRALIPIRDAVRAVLRAQEAKRALGQAQIRLRSAYGSFVRQFGPINQARITTRTDEETGEVSETIRRPNLAPFLDDPDCWLVASIEITTRTATPPGPDRSSRSGSSILRWSRSSPRRPMRSPSRCTSSATSTSTVLPNCSAAPVPRCSPSWAMPCSSIRP